METASSLHSSVNTDAPLQHANLKAVRILSDNKDPNSLSTLSKSVKLPNSSCENCALSKLCLPISVSKGSFDKLDSIIQRRKPIRQGTHLFRQGDEFSAIYVVRTGCVKTYTISPDGQTQITGFYTPGEILGMDGLNTNHHTNYAKTLENTSVCKVPFEKLEKLSQEIPSLQRYLFGIMAQEIQADQKLIMLISKRSADQRIAALLLNISGRFKNRQLSSSSFRLPMSRGDIGNYLGLAVETVSRAFSKLHASNILTAENKEVTIHDMEALIAINNTN